MSVQVQEQKLKQQVKLSQMLKDATEEQCFGHFMKISEISDPNEDHQIKSRAKSVKICVNGLLMSKSGIEDESSTPLSIYEYVADDEDILKIYRTLGIDYHRASFKKIGSYLEILGL